MPRRWLLHPSNHPNYGGGENTIQKLTRDLGEAVLEYHDNVVRNLRSQRVQCDEVWCFC